MYSIFITDIQMLESDNKLEKKPLFHITKLFELLGALSG